MNIFKYSLCVIWAVIIAIVTLISVPFDYKNRAANVIYRVMARVLLFISGVKISEVRGKENLDGNEAYLFLANHCSYADIPVLMAAIPNSTRFVYKKSMTKLPIFGWAMYAANYVPIDRTNAREALKSLRKAAEYIKNGLSIVIFPEGTRSPDGITKDFKKGMIVVADEAKCKVVPVAVDGTFDILPKNSVKLKGGTVKVSIGVPREYRKDREFLSELRDDVVRMKKELQK